MNRIKRLMLKHARKITRSIGVKWRNKHTVGLWERVALMEIHARNRA